LSAAGDAMRVSKPVVRDEITAMIETQLAAFREGDATKAYRCASEGFREQVSPVAFARMVARNYPEIWQNVRAEVGIVRDDDTRATVVVHVFAKNADALYDYVLFHEKTGWRIGGVLRRDPKKANGV
jgi:hypothetical protein